MDLYAGSGAVGLEALSRAAAHVDFVERAEPALRVLHANVARLGLTAGFRIHGAGVGSVLRKMKPGTKFDLVFLDPPFAASSDGGELAAAVSALAGWLTRDARIYVEHAKSDPPLALGDAWRELRTGTAGEVRYHLLAAAGAGG